MDDFVITLVGKLKSVVNCKCSYILNYADNPCYGIKEVYDEHDEFTALIKKEFDKSIR
ncbi:MULTISPECIES: hypothetical protein [Candidatus Ichthyocystis]|uniref:Uncharacterized protein n=1 Tax=Candidatus Ichthyocystis hellenicum TaxID=1561003 RepID=A0A0S4M8I3_9BURK|nr:MULTISPECIES: hypothetical protein [Ichthyocystis]CUT17700.1 hypothetical protein Ark11_0877 [Candidatus Ichthyocystis hellenicum]